MPRSRRPAVTLAELRHSVAAIADRHANDPNPAAHLAGRAELLAGALTTAAAMFVHVADPDRPNANVPARHVAGDVIRADLADVWTICDYVQRTVDAVRRQALAAVRQGDDAHMSWQDIADALDLGARQNAEALARGIRSAAAGGVRTAKAIRATERDAAAAQAAADAEAARLAREPIADAGEVIRWAIPLRADRRVPDEVIESIQHLGSRRGSLLARDEAPGPEFLALLRECLADCGEHENVLPTEFVALLGRLRAKYPARPRTGD